MTPRWLLRTNNKQLHAGWAQPGRVTGELFSKKLLEDSSSEVEDRATSRLERTRFSRFTAGLKSQLSKHDSDPELLCRF